LLLKRLELNNFRNYSRQVITPDPLFNIINGSNAQGKTNILESIFVASTGRSFRTLREKEIINRESDFSSINGLFETKGRHVEIKVLLRPSFKKIEVNGILTRGYPLQWPGVVLFTPDDLVMVKGPPQERRRFLDYEIGPFKPKYSYFLGLYNRVLSQRNKLLKDIREGKIKNESLRVWNEQLCRYGAKIISMRMELLKKIVPAMRSLHRAFTGGEEEIDVRYISSVSIASYANEELIYSRFVEDLKSIEGDEISRAHSLIGPHRDDLSFLVNGSDARIYGSQGQQRTIILTLKITQVRQWKIELNEYPILVLDDVLFELDSDRRQRLLRNISGLAQTFVSSTGAEALDFGKGYTKKIFIVKNGNIINK